MKTKISFLLFLMVILSELSFSQTTNCGQAVAQLQNYAAQVNQVYNNEYWTTIPNQRCPSFDQWGRPFNPQIVQNCRWQMVGFLNQWYGQQCNYVNNTYIQIMQGCASNPKSISRKPAPKPISGEIENEEIDTEQIEEMTAGIDEDKAIRITIPKTASGFKPKQ
jgi:hypothetical protein